MTEQPRYTIIGSYFDDLLKEFIQFEGWFNKLDSYVRGVLEDRIGTADFQGSLHREQFEFQKRYSQSPSWTESLGYRAPTVPVHYKYSRTKEGWVGRYKFLENGWRYEGPTTCQLYLPNGNVLGTLS